VKGAEGHRTVLAFLDQFISRGASASVLSFRDRFAMDPTEWERFQAELPSDAPSELEAFEAMRRVFAREFAAPGVADEPPVSFRELLSWTEHEPGGGTSDPAQWDDWLKSVQEAQQLPRPAGFTTVIRARLRLLPPDEGGRQGAIADGYRGNLAFGAPPVDETRRAQHGSVLVFEDVKTVEPGQVATMRAFVMHPTFLPLAVGQDTEIQLMEGHRVVAEATGAERLVDRTGRRLDDLGDAKVRPLDMA
jgi:hypothetical protein